MTHKEPDQVADYVALGAVRFLRFSFDILAGFKTGPIDEHKCERFLRYKHSNRSSSTITFSKLVVSKKFRSGTLGKPDTCALVVLARKALGTAQERRLFLMDHEE